MLEEQRSENCSLKTEMHRLQILLPALLCIVFTGFLLSALGWGESHLVKAELAAQDAIARRSRLAPKNPRLIFLAIDNESTTLDRELDVKEFFGIRDATTPEGQALFAMSERWPWSREVYALLLDRLIGAGARLVIFDLTFPKEGPGDEAWRAALERHRERVIVGSMFETLAHPDLPGSFLRHVVPSESLIPARDDAPDDRVGYVNFWTGPDEIVRESVYSLDYFGEDSGKEQARTYFSLAGMAARKLGQGELLAGRKQAGLPLRFAGPPHEGFPAHPLYEVFVPEFWEQNYQSGAAFRDAIVLVGAQGGWQHDVVNTPFGMMPGPELHLNALNSLLHGHFLKHTPQWVLLAVTGVAALLGLALPRMIRGIALQAAALLAILFIYIGACIDVHDRFHLILPLLPPVLCFGGNSLIAVFCNLWFTTRERSRLRRALERYVSRNVVKKMMDSPEAYTDSLGGVTRPVTILFSDVRNFTKLCANTPPEALVAQLNDYFSAMVECVFRNRGTLDKFMGDAVMAVWGNAQSRGPEQDARDALACAREMRAALKTLNARWEKEACLPMRVGIALNHGQVVVGNIGSPHRMEFTVIGDAVNVTWRIQERTKEHGCDLLLGEAVVDLLAGEIETEEMGSVVVGETITARYLRCVEDASPARSEAAVAVATA